MKQIKETRVCDFCGREGYLQRCIICKKEFCILCNYSSIFSLKVCRKCSRENPKVVKILERHLETWRRYNDRIEKALKNIL